MTELETKLVEALKAAKAALQKVIEDCGGCEHEAGVCVCPELAAISQSAEVIAEAEAAIADAASPWKNAVIEQLVVAHILTAEHESDPRKAIQDLLAYNSEIAVDPRVSDAAARLAEQARAEGREACAKACDTVSSDRWNLYKGRPPYSGREPERASDLTQGESLGADLCAEAIRTMGLTSDFHATDPMPSTGENQTRVDLKAALKGVSEFFDGDFYRINRIVSSEQAHGQLQEDECRPEFDHCFVDQGGGGLSGDDFHGTVYFHIGGGEYLAVEY